MLRLEKCRIPWIVVALSAALIPLGAQSARAENPASEQAVARALNLEASAVDGRLQILRSPLPAGARVHLLSVEKAPGSRGLLARMACDDRSQCLPFYALVSGTRLHSLAPPDSASPAAPIPTVKPPLRAGDRVEILEELSGLRLRTAGVCLQPGSVGDRIRVRTLSTHRVLVATVAAPNLVKVER